jgi:hypothetical protein
MRGLTLWLKTHWIFASILLGVLFVLVVLISGTGGVGAGVAATVWVACAGFFFNLNRSKAEDEKEQHAEQTAREKMAREEKASDEQKMLDNAKVVRDCVRELANQLDSLLSVLETTAPQDWGKRERSEFSQRFVAFAKEKRLIPRMEDALGVLRTYEGRIGPERGDALAKLIAVGNSAAEVVDTRDKVITARWLDFDLSLETWSELYVILELLRTKIKDVRKQRENAAKLSDLARNLKLRSPGVRVAEEAEVIYASLATGQPLPDTLPGPALGDGMH